MKLQNLKFILILSAVNCVAHNHIPGLLIIENDLKTEKALTSIDYISGQGRNKLLSNAYAYYTKYWKQKLKGYEETSGAHKILRILKNPSRDIRIKSVKGKIAIISRTARGMAEFEDLSKVEDIWIFRNRKWQRLEGYSNRSYSVRFLALNKDKFMDAIIEGGCCDTATYNIMLGTKTGLLEHRQDLSFLGPIKDKIKGPCKRATVRVKSYSGDVSSKLQFDCRTNRFEMIE